jgi:hypothetical protein
VIAAPAGQAKGLAKARALLLNSEAMRRLLPFLPLLLLSAPLAAKDSLGVFEDWGAFSDLEVPRCYAIAAAEGGSGAYQAYADVGTWPRQGVRGQIHFRLSHQISAGSHPSLSLGGKRYPLSGGGADVWALDKRADAAIVAAMRSAESMSLTATDRAGRRFTDRYSLKGAATAMDAATVGCARTR